MMKEKTYIVVLEFSLRNTQNMGKTQTVFKEHKSTPFQRYLSVNRFHGENIAMIYSLSAVSELQTRAVTPGKVYGRLKTSIGKTGQFLFCISVLNESSTHF